MPSAVVDFQMPTVDKRAHTTAGLITLGFAILLLLLLWFIKIYTPIPPIPPDVETPTMELFDLGALEGGTNQEMGGGSQGNTGHAGSQNSEPTPNDANPSSPGAITNENSDAAYSPAHPTPGSDKASVSDETQKLLDKMKNKKNNTAVNMNGGQGSGPYSSGGIGNDNGPGVGPGDGGIPGQGGTGSNKTIRIQFSPDVSNPTQEEGAVAVRVSVDRTGKVTKAEAVNAGSTTGNPILKSTATQSAYKVIFNSDDDRPEIVQCVITFNFTLTK